MKCMMLAIVGITFSFSAHSQTIGLTCKFRSYSGPEDTYGKFQKINGGLINLVEQKLDLVDTRAGEIWTYENAKPGSMFNTDRFAVENLTNKIVGGGIRTGGSYAFVYDRKTRIFLWTSPWAGELSPQTFLFDCLEGAAPRFN